VPKSRNRSNRFAKYQVVGRRLTEIFAGIAELAFIGNQHAQVINAQRDKIAKLELHIQLLEEKVYADLTPEERERLADILDPQPVIEGEVVTDPAGIEEALKDTEPATNLEPGASAAA
jgi:hypothetical protein